MAAPGQTELDTHQVINQPDPPGDRDLWQDDPILRAVMPGDHPGLAEYGATLGRAEMAEAARDANHNPPELRLFDSGGRRMDEVRFHPAYHRFMQLSSAAGYQSVAWTDAHGHQRHAAMVYLASQVEPGHCCPLTMTNAAVPVLAAADLPDDWHGKAQARGYDPRAVPVSDKSAITLGMAMTEKQGGSDVRANTTRAERDGDGWRLTGHKWFCSAPMSDGFLTLAQTGQGPTCFLVPRWLPGGRNAIHIQRLKDKLGNRANASAEVEYHRAFGWQLGEQGDGTRTIVEMVHHTRLDTAIAPAGLMRAALREALYWTANRTAFQKRLIDQPLVRAVLADLVLDWQGALTLGMAVARAFDGQTEANRSFARIGVALAKYMANKLCPLVVVEAMEVLGGMGYVEDTPLPMLYREAPLNGIWEGSGNVICLDVLRTLARDPLAAEALAARMQAAAGLDRDYANAVRAHRDRWSRTVPEAEARWFTERTALLLMAAELLQAGDATATAFVKTRLMGDHGRISGAMPQGLADTILRRIAEPAA